MSLGLRFSSIKVCDDIIIDGHHRYVASVLAKVGIERVESLKSSATEITAWHEVIFDVEDWDTENQIRAYHEIDAQFNEISLSEILNKLN
jgi:tRNA A37 threonylcarbamoyladenosine dehydratase